MISIVIPIYQCKWNIDQIMEDIFAQTYQDYEVLLVDDGSTDGSVELCMEYAKRDERVRAIPKEHSGVSETRNAGIAEAKGEYIAFIDCDDRVEADYLERLVEGIADNDMVIASFDREFYKDGQYVRTVKNVTLDAQIKMENELNKYFSILYTSTLIGTVVCKLFRRDIIQKNAVAFRDDIYIGEDYIFNFDYLKHCKSMCCIDYMGYHYICKEGNSLTHKKDLQKFEYGKILFQESLRFCEDMSLDSNAIYGVPNLYLRTCFKNIENLYQMEEKIKRKERRSFIKKVLADSDTKLALEMSKPDCMEFKIYKVVLKMGIPALVGGFSRLRLQYKRMLGRA